MLQAYKPSEYILMHYFLQGTFDLLTVEKQIKQKIVSIITCTQLGAMWSWTTQWLQNCKKYVQQSLLHQSYTSGGRQQQSSNNLDFNKNVFVKELHFLPTENMHMIKKSGKLRSSKSIYGSAALLSYLLKPVMRSCSYFVEFSWFFKEWLLKVLFINTSTFDTQYHKHLTSISDGHPLQWKQQINFVIECWRRGSKIYSCDLNGCITEQYLLKTTRRI